MNSTAFFDPSYIVSGLVYIFPYLKVTFGTDCQQCLSRHFLGPFLRFS